MKQKLQNISFIALIVAFASLCVGFIVNSETVALLAGFSILFFTGLNVVVSSSKLFKARS